MPLSTSLLIDSQTLKQSLMWLFKPLKRRGQAGGGDGRDFFMKVMTIMLVVEHQAGRVRRRLKMSWCD